MRKILLLLALALPLAAVPANAQISIFNLRNSLVQFALDQISTPGLTITAEDVVRAEEGGTELRGVAVADEEGVWLRAETLTLRWNARRILSAELDITELSAAGVQVLRRPRPVEVQVKEGSELAEAEAEPFSWPRSPITTHVREMRLDRVFVAGGVIAEQSIAFDARGSARDEGNIQAVDLALDRTDAVEGRISFDYERDFAADTLRLDLDAREAAGGLVAALAGFPEDSASRVDLSADGPLTDWDLTLDAGTDRVFDADGTASIDFEDRIAARALFNVVPGPEMAPQLATALGERARLEVDVAEDEGGLVRIRSAVLESPALSLEARGSYARPTTAIDVSVVLEAQPVLADLVEGVDFEGVDFDGRATGPLDNLEARGDLTLAGLATEPADIASAELATVVTVRGETVDFDVSGGAEGLRLDRIAPETVGAAELVARGRYDGQALTLETASLESVLLTAEARGEVSLAEERAGLDYRVAAPDLAPVAAAYDVNAAGSFLVTGAAEGPLANLRLNGEANLTDLRFEDEDYGQVTLTHDITTGEAIEGTARVEASGSPVGPAEAEARFALLGQILDLSRLRAEALGATVDGRLTYELDTGRARGQVNLDAPDLSPLARLSGTPAGGSVTGVVSTAPEQGRQNLALDLEVRDLRAFEAAVARLDLEGTVTDALGTPTLDARLDAADLGYEEARVASVEGTVTGTDLREAPSFELDLALRDAAGFGARAGTVAVTGTVTDATTLAGLEADLRASALAYEDATVDRLDAQVRGTDVLTGGPVAIDATATGAQGFGASAGTLTLDAEATDVTALAQAEATLAAETVGIADIRIARLDAEASGTDLLSAAPQGQARVDLGALSGNASGSGARLEARLEGAGANARLTATLDAGRLSASGASVAAVDLDATVADPLGRDPRIDARLDTGRVEAEGVTLAGIDLTAEGLLSALAVTLSTEGNLDDEKPIALDAAARIDATAPAPLVRANRLEARYGEERIALARPLTVEIGETITAEGIDLTLPGGRLTGDAALYPDGLGADIALDMDDLGLIRRFAEVPVQTGTFSARTDIDTRPGTAGGTLALDVTNLRIDGIGAETGALDLTARGDWNGRVADLQATLSGPFGEPLRTEAGVPLVAGEGLLPVLRENGPLSGGVDWTGEIGKLWVFVPLPDHVLEGRADVDIAISGTPAAPEIGGDIRIDDGRYQFLETGTILTDLRIASEVAPDGGFAVELTARDGANGTVTATVGIAGGEVDAEIDSDRAVLVRRDDITAAITLDLAAAGPLAGPDLSGRVTIDRAEVRLVNALPPTVPTLGEVRIKGAPPREPEEPAGSAIDLDIAVRAPRDVFVRGRGLDSEWSVNLDVSGTAATPRVVGAIERVRGRLALVGTRFDLRTGEIRFSGGREIDPRLDVRLVAEQNAIEGGIAITGNASDPEIGFFSTPALPESEVLPRLLFDRSSQSLSAGQALQIAAGLATFLDGTDSAFGVARELTGLDVIDIDTSGEEAAVTVGKNVGEDVFVGARQSLDGSETEVIVEIEVFPEVVVDAEVDEEGEASVGVNWQRNF